MSMILRILGLTAIAALAGAAVAGAILPMAPVDVPQAVVSGRAAPSALPPIDATAAQSLLGRSPFHPGRAPFSRNAPAVVEAPIEIKLAGVFKIGKETRASLVIAGQSLVVRKGDETPVGKVASIEANAVVIEGTPPRRIELFKQ